MKLNKKVFKDEIMNGLIEVLGKEFNLFPEGAAELLQDAFITYYFRKSNEDESEPKTHEILKIAYELFADDKAPLMEDTPSSFIFETIGTATAAESKEHSDLYRITGKYADEKFTANFSVHRKEKANKDYLKRIADIADTDIDEYAESILFDVFTKKEAFKIMKAITRDNKINIPELSIVGVMKGEYKKGVVSCIVQATNTSPREGGTYIAHFESFDIFFKFNDKELEF